MTRIRISFSFLKIASLLLVILVNFSAQNPKECYDDGAEFCIYQEDILSADLLPDSFILLDQRPDIEEAGSPRISNNGTIDEAFNAMGFHRKKMNEFFCHGFLAEQILTEVGGARVKRRLDNLPEDVSPLEYIGENNVSLHEKLLADEGSSKYKDWLQKTTTLDDIYQHYAPRSKSRKISKKQSADNRYDNIGEEYDGAVTGYAMPAPMPSGKIEGHYSPSGPDHYAAPSGHHSHQMDYFDHHGDLFYPQIHEEVYYSPPNHHHEQEHHYEHHRPSYHHGKGKGHELSLKDFFEIALTAIAFLAFGLFIIQLVMNVTNAATATAAAFVQADIEGTRYKRESGSTLGYTSNEELNELSHRVLRSIEAALISEQDNGNCLRRVLCDDNKQSRENTGGKRIWVPVWSLGMSWLSGRMLQSSRWSTTLGSVKAAVLGLGGADCTVLFPDCDLKQEVTKSRRRRRRRRRRRKK